MDTSTDSTPAKPPAAKGSHVPADHLGAGSREEVEGVIGRAAGSRIRLVAWASAAVVIVAAATAYYFHGSSSGGVAYRTDTARTGDIIVSVIATGTVQPTNKVDVSSELSGIIRAVHVDFNSKVTAGDVLAELDTDKRRAAVESARARVAAARARVTEAEATLEERRLDLDRKTALVDRRVVATQDLDVARAALYRAQAASASASADVEAAEADLRLAETNLSKTCICTPISGTVLARQVDPGQVVAASLQAPVLFTIAEDLTKIEVQVDVDEADMGAVREGQPAMFTVDAYPDRSFDARIQQLRFGSEVVQGVVTYKAILSAENPDMLLRPGMTATAEVTVNRQERVLTVSNEALRYTPSASQPRDNRSLLQKLLPGPPGRGAGGGAATAMSGSERQIWLLRGAEAVPVEVTLGATDGSRTQIVGGEVAPGDEVIVDAVSGSS